MNHTAVRALSRVLIVCLTAVSLQAQAGLIGTGDVAAPSPAPRAAIERRLQSLGVSADEARARVAALTDAEAAQLAARVDDLPAGAFGGLVLGAFLVAVFLIWRFEFSDQAKAEKAPAKK